MNTPPGERTAFAPPVCLQVAVPDGDCRLIPFWRVMGSIMEWSAYLISDRELCRALRRAAAEVERGGF